MYIHSRTPVWTVIDVGGTSTHTAPTLPPNQSKHEKGTSRAHASPLHIGSVQQVTGMSHARRRPCGSRSCPLSVCESVPLTPRWRLRASSRLFPQVGCLGNCAQQAICRDPGDCARWATAGPSTRGAIEPSRASERTREPIEGASRPPWPCCRHPPSHPRSSSAHADACSPADIIAKVQRRRHV